MSDLERSDAALFRRTPEQIAVYDGHIDELRTTSPHIHPKDISNIAYKRMRDQFPLDLDRLACERAGVVLEEGEDMSEEQTAARELALAEVCKDLALLDKALRQQNEVDEEPVVAEQLVKDIRPALTARPRGRWPSRRTKL